MRRRNEKQRLRGMGHERAISHPQLRYHLADQQPESSRRQARQAGDLPPVPGPWAIEQPEREGRDDEERHRPIGDEVLDLVTDRSVTAKRAVQKVEDRPVDPPTIVGDAPTCTTPKSGAPDKRVFAGSASPPFAMVRRGYLNELEPRTTWLFVTMSPAASRTIPEPSPCRSSRLAAICEYRLAGTIACGSGDLAELSSGDLPPAYASPAGGTSSHPAGHGLIGLEQGARRPRSRSARFFFDGPLGRRDGFEALVRYRHAAFDREPVRPGGQARLRSLDRCELLA